MITMSLLLTLEITSADLCKQNSAAAAVAVAKVDRAYRQAWVGPDLKIIADTLADEWTVIHVNGRRQGKEEFLNALKRERVHFLESTISDVVVRPYGAVAVLTERAHNRIQSNGSISEGDVRLTAVYVCRGAKWRAVAEQATHIDPPSPPQSH